MKGEGPGKYKRTKKHSRFSSLLIKKRRRDGWVTGTYKRTAEHRRAVSLMNKARGRKSKKETAYDAQKKQAKDRGIRFLLTFDQWSDIWEKSGRWHKRGCHRGQYVMSRPGDKGPYASWNVQIITTRQNHHEGHLGKKRGPYLSAKKTSGRKSNRHAIAHART